MTRLAQWDFSNLRSVQETAVDLNDPRVSAWLGENSYRLTQDVELGRPLLVTDSRGKRCLQFVSGETLTLALPQAIRNAAAGPLTLVVVAAIDAYDPAAIASLTSAVTDAVMSVGTDNTTGLLLSRTSADGLTTDSLSSVAPSDRVAHVLVAAADNVSGLTVSDDGTEDTGSSTVVLGAGDLDTLTLGGTFAGRIYTVEIHDSPPAVQGVIVRERIRQSFSSNERRFLAGFEGQTDAQNTIRLDAEVGVQDGTVPGRAEVWANQRNGGSSMVQEVLAEQPLRVVTSLGAGLNTAGARFMESAANAIRADIAAADPANSLLGAVFNADVGGAGTERILFHTDTVDGFIDARINSAGQLIFTVEGSGGQRSVAWDDIELGVDVVALANFGNTNVNMNVNGVDQLTPGPFGPLGTFGEPLLNSFGALGGTDGFVGIVADLLYFAGSTDADGFDSIVSDMNRMHGDPAPVATNSIYDFDVDPSRASTVSGDPVDSVTNNGTIVGSVSSSGSNRPTQALVNALGALQYSNAANTYLRDTGTLAGVLDGATAFTILQVLDPDTPGPVGNETYLQIPEGFSTDRVVMACVGTVLFFARPASGASQFQLDMGARRNVRTLYTFRAGPTLSIVGRIDGVTIDSITPRAFTLANSPNVSIGSGGAGTATDSYEGRIGRTIIVPREMSDAELGALETQLMSDWGIP